MILNQVKNNLFIGNIFSLNHSILETNNINHIISLIDLPEQIYQQNPQICIQSFPFADDPSIDIVGKCAEIYPYLLKATESGSVLVICNAGRSRSSAVVLYFLTHSNKLTFQQAYDFLSIKHPQIELNRGFYQQLGPRKHPLSHSQ